MPKLTKAETNYLMTGSSDPSKKTAALTEAKQKEILARKAALLRIYTAYHSRELFKDLIPPKMKITLNNSEAEIQTALDGVRHSLNAAGAGATIRKIYPSLVVAIIQALAKAGLLEQVGLAGTEHCGPDLERMLNSPVMGTEVAEMEIELESWFSSAWYVRLTVKTYMLLKAYGDSRARMERRVNVPQHMQPPSD
jgi:hypothetical protein